MRMANWGLSVLFGLIATISIGAGEAKSQQSLIRVCNNTDILADIAVTGLQNGNYVIKGWWTAQPGQCTNTTYVEYGWVYLYAANFRQAIQWGGGGNPRRFCIVQGAMERVINPQYQCPPELLKSFSGYFTEVGTFTWNLNP
jgi:uncharacterized membrane protein